MMKLLKREFCCYLLQWVRFYVMLLWLRAVFAAKVTLTVAMVIRVGVLFL